MKKTDMIRRVFFTISAEGASLFEWAIWSTLLTFLVGFPIAISVLQSFLTGLLISMITGVSLFIISFVVLGISDKIISQWPFTIGDDELEFEKNYTPRIPND